MNIIHFFLIFTLITKTIQQSFLIVDVSPFEIAEITIKTSELNPPIAFKTEFDIKIVETTSNNEITYSYPFQSITSTVTTIPFRLFNYANSVKSFNFSATCLIASCPLSQLPRAFSTNIKKPSRAIWGTTNVFPIVLNEELYSKISLPLNFFDISDEIFIDFPIQTFPANFKYDKIQSDETLRDKSYWNDKKVVVLPWLPFITHCENNDKRIFLFDVLENTQDGCSYKTPAETKTIQTIPTSGFTAVSDSCTLKYSCHHLDIGKSNSRGVNWWELTELTGMFYIGRDSMLATDVIGKKSNTLDNYFENMLSGSQDSVIKVDFQPIGAVSSGFPQKVALNIDYAQISSHKKQLIAVRVVMSNYVTKEQKPNNYHQYVLEINYKSLDYFGLIDSFKVNIIVYLSVFLVVSLILATFIYLFWRANKFVFSFKRKYPPTLKFFNTFKITFIPELQGSMLSNVLFSFLVLFFLSVIYPIFGFNSLKADFTESSVDQAVQNQAIRGRIGVCCFIFSFLALYQGAQLMINIPNSEQIKIIENHLFTDKILEKQLEQRKRAQARSQGVPASFKTKTLVETAGGIYQSVSNSQEDIDYSRDDPTNSISFSDLKEPATTVRKSESVSSRISVGGRRVGILDIQRMEEEERQREIEIKKEKEEKRQEKVQSFKRKSQKITQQQQNSLIIQEHAKKVENMQKAQEQSLDIQQMKRDGLANIILNLKRKQDHFILVCLMAGMVLVYILRPSQEDTGQPKTSNTVIMIFLLIVDSITSLLLKHFLLREILLLAPISVSFEIAQYIVVMRAETFSNFILDFLLRTLLIVLFRVYLDPILKNVEVYLSTIVDWINGHSQIQFLHKYTINKRNRDKKWKNVEAILEKPLNKQRLTLEPIIFTLVNFTTKQAARFIFPCFLLFNYMFNDESQITKLYGLTKTELSYYMVFWIFMFIPSFIMETYLFNILEVVHGHRLYNYLNLCQYRFKYRVIEWLSFTHKIDQSISAGYRSIHNFCFSSQYYFSICSSAWGMLYFIIGLYIILINEHKVFADEATLPIVGLVYAAYLILRISVSKFAGIFKVWKIPPASNETNRARVSENFDKLQNKAFIKRQMKTDLFRQQFLQKNKMWLMANLNKIVDVDESSEINQQLTKIYKSVHEDQQREDEEKRRKEFIQLNKKKYEDAMTFGDHCKQSTSINGQSDFHNQVQINVKKWVTKQATYLLYNWYYHANQTVFLRNLVAEIDASKLKTNCQMCSQDHSLQVVPQIPITYLASRYRIDFAGLAFNKYEWLSYYNQKQRFLTLCDECTVANKMKNRIQGNTLGLDQAQIFDNDLDIDDNTNKAIARAIPLTVKKALLVWHSKVSSSVLHKAPVRIKAKSFQRQGTSNVKTVVEMGRFAQKLRQFDEDFYMRDSTQTHKRQPKKGAGFDMFNSNQTSTVAGSGAVSAAVSQIFNQQ